MTLTGWTWTNFVRYVFSLSPESAFSRYKHKVIEFGDRIWEWINEKGGMRGRHILLDHDATERSVGGRWKIQMALSKHGLACI